METDTLKRKDCAFQWLAEDSAGEASSPSTADEKVELSLGLGWVNSANDSITEQVTPLHTLVKSSVVGRNGALPDDMSHSQAFQDAKPLSCLASSICLPHLSIPAQTGMFHANQNDESVGISHFSAAASPPPPQEAIFYENGEQGSGQQEQLMIHQIEQLQRVVSEQQKIITLYNPGFSASPGTPPHLLAMMPSLPRIPAALFPAQLPLQNSVQAQNNGCSQTTPLIVKPALEQCAPGTPGNPGSCLKASREHPEPQETEASLLHEDFWLKTLSPIEEEKGEQQTDEHLLLFPFGRKKTMTTGNVEDGSIGAGIGVRQNTFEEFVEKVKVESQGTEKQQQNLRETKVVDPKSFLKCREGTVRFEEKKEAFGQESTRLLRKVSFDCQDHLPWPNQWDTRKLLGGDSQLKKQISSSTGSFMDAKDTRNITPSSDVESQVNTCEQKSEERKGSRNFASHKHEKLESEKEPDAPSQINWSKCSQECHGQINAIMAKVTEKAEGSCPSSQRYSGGTENRLMDSSPDVSELPNLETGKQIGHEAQCSRLQVIQGASGNGQCKNKYCGVMHKSPEIQGETGFKKLNDQIVKVGHNPDRKQETATANNAQRKHYNSIDPFNRWNGNLSSDSNCTSTDSEGEPKSHCSQYAIRPSSRRTANTDRNLDLSDADYATDEASDAEDVSWKGHRKLPVKKDGDQKLLSQQEAPLLTSSSSESSAGAGGLNGRRQARSPLRKSPNHPSKSTRKGRKPETQDNPSYSMEFHLQSPSLASDLVTSLFPVFKTRADLDYEKVTPEHFPKRPTDKLDKWEGELQGHHRENSLLAQTKAKQTKAMDSLRKQINQFETTRPLKLHQLEECKNEDILKLLKEKAEFEKHTTTVKVEGGSGEIQILKQQIAGLQEEFRRNESYWHVAHGKLRSQVEALTKQNLELQDELRASEYQRMEAERKYSAADLISRKEDIPVVAAFARGTSAQETLEERPSWNSHKSDNSVHVGRKMPLGELVPTNTQARSALKRSESLKSASGEHRAKLPSKTLHNRSATPTDRRTPHQTPFEELQKTSQLAHHQQQIYGRKSSTSVSNFNVPKDCSSSLHLKGTYSSTSGSSEDAGFLKRQNILSSASLSNEEMQGKENLKNTQRSPQLSEQISPTTTSKRNSITSSGRKTPVEHSLTSVDTEAKISPPKSILSRRALLYVESRKDEEVKERIEYPDGKIYYYADARTTHTIFPGGLEVLQFPNNQIEKHHPDGTKEIVFPDQTVKRLYDGGLEETVFPDGTVVKVEKNGAKTVLFNNGQKEIHTAQFKRREYPDGTVKTVYANGQQETKYSSGRVRIKDEKGSLILDQK
ncbi:hypothetical protein lerEdw1_006163 [Lerista edwardsae]|nr:hypothetical protein lerEdw1_006163 [Lerista edwardsae]